MLAHRFNSRGYRTYWQEFNRVMLFRETVAVYCENHTEHINTLCGQNGDIRNVKAVLKMAKYLSYLRIVE
jgi:hypothetical protein